MGNKQSKNEVPQYRMEDLVITKFKDDSSNPLSLEEILHKVDLTIHGFLHKFEQTMNCHIPREIKELIVQFYPWSTISYFQIYNAKLYESSLNGNVITGKSSNNDEPAKYHMILAQSEDFKHGYCNGIHWWSVKNYGGCKCIGIISSQNFNQKIADNLLIKQNTNNMNSYMIHWVSDSNYGARSNELYYRGNWKVDEIRTIELDCDKNKVTFFKGFREVKSKSIINGLKYYFAIAMSINATSKAEIVYPTQL